MDTTAHIQEIKRIVDETIASLFDSMLSMQAGPSEPGGTASLGTNQVIGMVGVTGAARGVVCLRASLDFALRATTAMFGEAPDTIHPASDVDDVIGELTNIIAGRLSSQLQLGGGISSLSLPTITRGEHIDLKTISSVDRHSFRFTLYNHPVVVDLYTVKKDHNGMDIPKILLVDDSKATRAVLTKLFFGYHCEILEASNGALGLEMARMHQPSLVILDMTMPVMDGVEMLRRLKSDDSTRAIPVIMLSANSNPEQMEQLRLEGLSNYITKTQKPRVILEAALEILPLEAKAPAPAQA
jgi:CheY-like chemotaxis protein